MEANENTNTFLPNVKFEAIPIRDLVTNQDYQRNLSIRHVPNTAAHFDIRQINPVKVSRRDDVNYVFNGQHTMEIVALISGSRDTPVWCMVYEDLGYTAEADIFANQQKYVKGLTPYEIFMANIEAGSDKQLLIKGLVEKYNLEITYFAKPCGILAVGALEYIYDRYGLETLSRTIRLAIGAWEGNQQSLGASVLKGIAKLIGVYGTDIKDETFIDKLGNVSIKEIIRSAKERKGGAMGFSEAMLMEYNKKSHSALSIQKLYARSVPKSPSSPEESLREAFDQIRSSQIVDSQGQIPESEIQRSPSQEANNPGTGQEPRISA